MVEVYSRRCRRCGQRKPVAEFNSNGKPSHSSGISGWKAYCKACEAALAALEKIERMGDPCSSPPDPDR